MQASLPLACFLSIIHPPGIQFENALLQISPVDKSKCPYVRQKHDIGFQLYTRHNPTVYQELMVNDDERLFASNMDFNDETVIYFHAFMEQPADGSAVMVREAYVQRGDTNVIMVDAQHLEAGPWYFTAAENTWYIGRYAGQFIDYLVSRGLKLSNTHLVGHSLGAHSAGVAGAALTTGRVSRITGLDPALPLFDKVPLEQRLDPTDAEFVDVIHTDAGIFGFPHPIGHADFFPNGGKSPQPGCNLEVVLPQQLLLNKCDDTAQTVGFYIFYLVEHKTTNANLRSNENVTISTETSADVKGHTGEFKTASNDSLYTAGVHNAQPVNTKPYPVKSTDNTKHIIHQKPINLRNKQTKLQNNMEYSTSLDNNHTNNMNEENKNPTNKINTKVTTATKSEPIETTNDIFHLINYSSNNKDHNDTIAQLNKTQLVLKEYFINSSTLFNKLTTATNNKTNSATFMQRNNKQQRNRQRRNIQFPTFNSNNFLQRILRFFRYGNTEQSSITREILTLVKFSNDELINLVKEGEGFSPSLRFMHNLEWSSDGKIIAFFKRFFGAMGGRLSITEG